MADEFIDIYDEHNQNLFTPVMKSFAHANGLWHRAVHIWMYTNTHQILLQLRAKNKDLYPNLWDISVAGHISFGEQPIESARRELAEEIGLTVSEDELTLQKEEVHQIKLFCIDVLKSKIKANLEQFVPHGNYWY